MAKFDISNSAYKENMAKKTSGGSPKNKSITRQTTVSKKLITELNDLALQLDEESLAFLVEQAKVHLYNMQVDEHNRAVIAQAENSSAGKQGRAGKSAAAAQKPGGAGFSIKGTESGSSFYLHYKNDDIMFSRGEMSHIVKIVNDPGTDLEIRERLYNWFDRERRDFFSIVSIRDKFDARLKELVVVIKKNLKLRDD